ncbi:NOSIC protein [Phytophthora cactorum]|nr:NOSIC protein [Phytophthora cactorum]
MLVLFETAAGHALFKVQDEAKLASADDVFKHFSTPEKAAKVLKLKGFNAFKDTTEAVAAATDMVDGKMGKTLKKFLKKNRRERGYAWHPCQHGHAYHWPGGRRPEGHDARSVALALALKLKFSADKVDTMIVQAIGLLDELDKEINTYSMRVREWFGWHFPEMGKIVTDNLQYAKCVLKMGMRTQVKTLDFSDILSEDVEASMREVCEVSMGTDISEEDVINISALCEQLVGARLIAHAGSLMNLAKHPASTVQILGAEKALFRALKTKHDTPNGAGCACGRSGRLHEATIGFDNRAKVEARVRSWRTASRACPTATARPRKSKKYVKTETSKSYNADADMTVSSKKRKAEAADEDEAPKVKKDKKHKKKKSAEENSDDKKDKKKKHKKKKSAEE